jgi:hypothetical protein
MSKYNKMTWLFKVLLFFFSFFIWINLGVSNYTIKEKEVGWIKSLKG